MQCRLSQLLLVNQIYLRPAYQGRCMSGVTLYTTCVQSLLHSQPTSSLFAYIRGIFPASSPLLLLRRCASVRQGQRHDERMARDLHHVAWLMGLPPTCSPSIVGMMIYGPSLTAHAHLGHHRCRRAGLAARQRPEHEPDLPSAGARAGYIPGLTPQTWVRGLLCVGTDWWSLTQVAPGSRGVENGWIELR